MAVHSIFKISVILAVLGLAACGGDPTSTPSAPISGDKPTGATSAGSSGAPKFNEAKTYVGSFNRGQQAFFISGNKFATNIEDLGLGLKDETAQYKYKTQPQGDGTQSVVSLGIAKESGLPNYLGLVYAVPDDLGGKLTLHQLCQTDKPVEPLPTLPAAPKSATDKLACPEGFQVAK